MAIQTTASPTPTAAAADDGTDDTRLLARGQSSSHAIDVWSRFEEMLAWLEIGDAAQARRAFLRALNAV